MNAMMSNENNNGNINSNEIMAMLQLAAYNNKQASEQMGLMINKVNDVENRVAGLEDRVQKYEDRIRISRTQAKTLWSGVHRRVNTVLHIEHEGGVVAHDCINDDVKYKGGFMARCWADAKRYGKVGDPYTETFSRDYDEAMEFIESWRPCVEGGVEGYKRYLDARREARLKKTNS